MADWPRIGRVDDTRMMTALRDSEPDALRQLYRAYAARLYDYCHQLLRDELDAARALHDAFVVVSERVQHLRATDQFRAWLYLVARNECLRRRDTTDSRADRREAPSHPDEAVLDEPAHQQRDETRKLVRSAQAGMEGSQLELLDLSVRHEIDGEELAAILMVSVPDAIAAVEQAREDFDHAFSTAIIAVTGREDCGSVAALVDRWPLNPRTSERLMRHIESCAICGNQPQRRASLPRLLRLMPVAALPGDLESWVLTTAGGPADDRTDLAKRAGPWDEAGWPMPVRDSDKALDGEPRRPSRVWAGLLATACVLILGGGAVAVAENLGGNGPGTTAQNRPTEPGSIGPSGSDQATPGPSMTKTKASPTPKASTSKKAKQKHGAKPTPTQPTAPTTTSGPTGPGTLSVSGCSIGSGQNSCQIVITADGGPVHWSVNGDSGRVSASGSGDLGAGQSTVVDVSVSRPLFCFNGSTGTVSFSPDGSASVPWSC